jgi:CheY-like chemotaxis protein
MVVEEWAPRAPVELLQQQLKAIDAWNQARAMAAHAHRLHAESREQHLEASRRLEAMRHEQDALLARASSQMVQGAKLLASTEPRIVIAHRQEWFRDRVAARLAHQQVAVLASVDDGAEAIAASICDQPDLLIIEELMPSVTGLEVLGRVQEYSPGTKVAVQAVNVGTADRLLEAGAVLVCSRRIPPHVLADHLLACLLERRNGDTLL